MTEKDFGQLKGVRTPEEWIDKALLIPNKKNKPLLFRPSVIGAAASLLVIAAAALTLFFNLRRLPEPAPQTVFQTATAANASTEAETVRPTQPADTQPTTAAIPPATVRPQTATAQTADSSAVSPVPLPTAAPTVQPTLSPTVKPTAAPTVPATCSTYPLTEPPETKLTVPVTVPATPPYEEELYYMGRILFRAGADSAFADSASVRVTLSQSGYTYSNLTVPLRIDGAGERFGVLPLYEEAILLYADSTVTVTVSDGGHTVSETVFLTFGNDSMIHL